MPGTGRKVAIRKVTVVSMIRAYFAGGQNSIKCTVDWRAINPPIATARLLMAAGSLHRAKVMLIGAATGYCAALLAELGADSVAVECDPGLAARAAGVAGITLVQGALADGAPAHAPYDLILIDGAIEHIPQNLIEQLRDGGRIVTGLIRGAVTQLARGVKTNGNVVLVPFADMEIVHLPGFDSPEKFEF